ncbi:hypothetical protein ACWCWQ_02280 [Streptomyces sp. NPDC001571]
MDSAHTPLRQTKDVHGNLLALVHPSGFEEKRDEDRWHIEGRGPVRAITPEDEIRVIDGRSCGPVQRL